MPPTGKIRIAAQIEIEWLHGCTAQATCPNCGFAGEMAQILTVDDDLEGENRHKTLMICPRCSVRTVDDLQIAEYESEKAIRLGWHHYQAQIGAGIWPITAPLARVVKPAGARVLEIGGAYGFGLDFCIHARGWRGEGFDPSPLAAHGARALGLNVRQSYLTADHLGAGPWDVAIATEVIEHLADPPAFLRLMRAALATDGILVLTTPDAEWITPELGAGDLVALLAPDAHLILQTWQSLEHALRAAGFTHVALRRDGMTLIAYASASPFALNEDFAAAHALYRHYLAERGQGAEPGSDAQLGFAGRALFEAVNAADWAAAEAAWAAFRAGVRARYGYDPEALLDALPPGCADASLVELGQRMPLGLGVIFYSRAMQRLGQGEGRAPLRPLFALALTALTALQNALAKRSLGDGLAGNIADLTALELLLCAAEAGEPESVDALCARGDVAAGWRGFVALVNAGAYAQAARLQQALLGETPGDTLPAGLRRDALFAAAMLHLAAENWPRGAAGFATLRAGLRRTNPPGAVPEPLFWPALRGEVVALHRLGRYEEASLLLRDCIAAYPGAPDDLRQQIDPIETLTP